MKTTEFIKESIDQPEYNDEVGMVKSNLHTLVRMSVELAKSLKDNENLPEWAQEKIAVAKSMIVAVGDYIISQHEMGQQPEVTGFNMDRAFAEAMDEADLSVTGTKSLAPIQGDKVEIKFGYNDYYDHNVSRGEVLQIRPDGYAVVSMDRTGKTENFPVRFLKVIGARAHVPNPNPTPSTPLTLRPDQTSSLANYNKWAKERGVAEARPDVMRHAGDKTVKVVKKGGKPVGEIGIDAEASDPRSPYYVKLYDGSYDASGFDTAEEALEELKYAISEGYDSAGAYDKWDPKHPDFVKNYRKFQASNPGATLADFVAHMKKGVSEDAASVKYGVFRKGGSIGGDNSKPIKTFDSKEEAMAFAKDRRSGLSKGERGYYRMGYVVKAIKGVAEGDPKPVTTGHFADKKGQPKPYPALKNTSTGKVRPHPNDPDQGVAEVTGDPKFDKVLKDITGKKAVTKQQKADTKQQARDAFGGMFGGNSSDLMKNLKIRESGGLKEDATAGGTSSSVVASTVETLGQKGEFSKKEVNKKLGGYTNQLSRGGPVKIGKAK